MTVSDDGSKELELTNERQQLRGSFIQPVHSVRKMKTYLVTDSELMNLTILNLPALVFFSLGSASMSAYFSIFIGVQFQSELPPSAESIRDYLQPLFLITGAVSYLVGAVFLVLRRTLLGKIRQEPQEIR